MFAAFFLVSYPALQSHKQQSLKVPTNKLDKVLRNDLQTRCILYCKHIFTEQ